MQNERSQEIIKRFFQAIHTLVDDKKMRGVATFTDRYGINRWNFLQLEKEPSRDMFELEWFTVICRDYDVNPYWLLSGEGEFYSQGTLDKLQRIAREEIGMGRYKNSNEV